MSTNANVTLCLVPDTDKLDKPEIKAGKTYIPTTIIGLLNRLKEKYSEELISHPTWPSTEELGKNIADLEAQYKEIASVVDAYRKKFEKNDGFYKSADISLTKTITSLANDPGNDDVIKTIDALKVYIDAKETKLREYYTTAYESLESSQSCLEFTKGKMAVEEEKSSAPSSSKSTDISLILIAMHKKKGLKNEFSELKKDPENFDALFSDLKTLSETFETFATLKQKSSRSFNRLYALFLEFKLVLSLVIKIKDPDDFENALKDKFKEWVFSVYEYFYFQREFNAKQSNVRNSWKNYEEFLKSRRVNFLNEAEEIQPATGGC